MKRAKETDPFVLLTLAREADAIRIEQGEAAYQAFKACQPAFCHEAHSGRVVVDLVERLIALAQPARPQPHLSARQRLPRPRRERNSRRIRRTAQRTVRRAAGPQAGVKRAF
jgi:hypothetical protein